MPRTPLKDTVTPPRGASFVAVPGGFTARATTRSSGAFFIVPFLLVWSGTPLGWLYGSQIRAGRFDLVVSLIGLPFVFGALVLGSLALMEVFGHVEVARDGDEGRVFTGIGNVGWTRRFVWDDLQSVYKTGFTSRSKPAVTLSFRSGSRPDLIFGETVSDERRSFLVSAIRSQMS